MRHKDLSWVQGGLMFLGVGLCIWNMPLGMTFGLLFLLPVGVAIELGYSRDRSGWMWGLFLGWLGVVILACMRPVPQRPGF